MFLNGRIDKCGMLIEVILKVRNFSGNEIQDQKQNKTKKMNPTAKMNKTNKQTITIQSNSGADWKQNQKNVLKIKING